MMMGGPAIDGRERMLTFYGSVAGAERMGRRSDAAARKRKGHARMYSAMATIGDLSFLALRLLQLKRSDE